MPVPPGGPAGPAADDAPLMPDQVHQGPAAGPSMAASAGAQARGRVYWWIPLAVIIADQATKAMIRARVPLFDSVNVIPGVLDFVHVRNAGLAFGFLIDTQVPFKTAATVAMAAIALAGIVAYARHVRDDERFARIGLSLILGGATGNLIDRLRLGYVIDFVDVYWRQWHFWAFNVADATITIGAVLVFFDLLFMNRHASHPV